MDHGLVAAEGTALELKRQISGDIIEIGMAPQHYKQAEVLLNRREDIIETHTAADKIKLYVNAGEKALPEILPLLADAGIPVKTIEMSRPSLDEVFLKMTGHLMTNGEKENAQ